MNIYASQSMVGYIHSALLTATEAIAEVAVDLASQRIKSDLNASELHGIYFSLDLYREALEALPRKPSTWDRKLASAKQWFGNPADLHGHVRAVDVLRLALGKVEMLLKQPDLDDSDRNILYGLAFGVEASVNTLEAYLKIAPGRLTPVYAIAM